ncbi:helix-turn-helix domain-containing protein [Lacticaseibacillus saniviri]|uniref:helix-turn-helix domain-containing protein n=1 Tax=Lacticaseibacillus saniviri TaxID=931533 RepID=UPI001EDD5EEB|nr:helix-turn-helix transcriptional regulator [Lacticaseibacillus saniviri]MCG4280881.1 helix-turn-helix transcriptional regulator [Lacticaseibacillus saniviri]
MNHHELIISKINDLLEEKNMTVNRLATLSGLTQSTLSGLFNRPNAVPKLDTLYAIAEGFNISLTELLDFPPYNERPNGTSAAKQRDKWEELGNALTDEEKERVRRILIGDSEVEK